jgi:hypothetical protein
MSNKEITRVPEILPDNLAAESVEFVTFLKKYYEWMGQEGNPSHQVDLSLTQRTLSNATDFYLSSLYNELGYGFVLNKESNQENLINNLSEIYSAKGSLQSIKVMFRALFGEEIEIKLPKEQILKASSGNWLSEYSVIVELNQGDLYSTVGKYVEVETTFPNTPTQTFDVEVKRVEQREESNGVYEVYVSRYFAGFFYFDSVIKYGDVVATLKTTMAEIANIEEGGTGFRVGEVFEVKDFIRSTNFNELAGLPTQFRRRSLSRSNPARSIISTLSRFEVEDVDVDVRSDGTITQTIKSKGSVTTKTFRGSTVITRIEFENGKVKEFKETLDGIPTPNLAVNWDAISSALTELTNYDSLGGVSPIGLYAYLLDTPTGSTYAGTSIPDPTYNSGGDQYKRIDFDRDGQFSTEDALSVIKYAFDFNVTGADTNRFLRITEVFEAWNAYALASGLTDQTFTVNAGNPNSPVELPIDVAADAIKLSLGLLGGVEGSAVGAEYALIQQTAGLSEFVKGDIDNDGQIDTDDLIAIIKYSDSTLRSTLSADQSNWITAYIDVGGVSATQQDDSDPAISAQGTEQLEKYASAFAALYQSNKRNSLHDYLLETDGDYATGRVRGDITQTGRITLDDVRLLLQRAAGYYDVSKGGVSRIDVNELIGGYIPDSGSITLENTDGGNQAAYNTIIRDGVITGFEITSAGEGIRSAKAIVKAPYNSVVESPPFTWLRSSKYYEADLTISNGRIQSIALPSLMYNFPENPIERISAVYDNAILTPVIAGDGTVTSVTVVDGGTGYSEASSTISLASSVGDGFEGTVLVKDNVIDKVTVTEGGSGYGPATTTVTILNPNGTGASLEPVIVGGVITAINILDGGEDYVIAGGFNNITVSDSGSGQGANISGFETISGVIDQIQVGNGGSGYSASANNEVTVYRGSVNDNPRFPKMKAIVQDKVITNLDVVSQGINYGDATSTANSFQRYEPALEATINEDGEITEIVATGETPIASLSGWQSATLAITEEHTFKTSAQDGLNLSYLFYQSLDRGGDVDDITDPSITISLGDTVTFDLGNASGDLQNEFYIKTSQAAGTTDAITDSTVTGRGTATVSFTPTSAGTYYYQSSQYSNMSGEIVVANDAATATVTIQDSKITGFNITAAGTNYNNPTVTISGTRADAQLAVVGTPNYVEWIDEVIAEPLLGTANNPILIDGPGTGANARVSKIGSNGEIEQVQLSSFGFDYPESFTSIIAPEGSGGTNAKVTFRSGVVGVTSPKYVDRKGFVSDIIKIQDNDLYQEFSYVIQTGVDFDLFESLIKKSVHPAGMKIFGEQSINDNFELSVSQTENSAFYYNKLFIDNTSNGELLPGGDGTSTKNDDFDVYGFDKVFPAENDAEIEHKTDVGELDDYAFIKEFPVTSSNPDDLVDSTADAEHLQETRVTLKDMSTDDSRYVQFTDVNSEIIQETRVILKDMSTPAGAHYIQFTDVNDEIIKETYEFSKEFPTQNAAPEDSETRINLLSENIPVNAFTKEFPLTSSIPDDLIDSTADAEDLQETRVILKDFSTSDQYIEVVDLDDSNDYDDWRFTKVNLDIVNLDDDDNDDWHFTKVNLDEVDLDGDDNDDWHFTKDREDLVNLEDDDNDARHFTKNMSHESTLDESIVYAISSELANDPNKDTPKSFIKEFPLTSSIPDDLIDSTADAEDEPSKKHFSKEGFQENVQNILHDNPINVGKILNETVDLEDDDLLGISLVKIFADSLIDGVSDITTVADPDIYRIIKDQSDIINLTGAERLVEADIEDKLFTKGLSETLVDGVQDPLGKAVSLGAFQDQVTEPNDSLFVLSRVFPQSDSTSIDPEDESFTIQLTGKLFTDILLVSTDDVEGNSTISLGKAIQEQPVQLLDNEVSTVGKPLTDVVQISIEPMTITPKFKPSFRGPTYNNEVVLRYLENPLDPTDSDIYLDNDNEMNISNQDRSNDSRFIHSNLPSFNSSGSFRGGPVGGTTKYSNGVLVEAPEAVICAYIGDIVEFTYEYSVNNHATISGYWLKTSKTADTTTDLVTTGVTNQGMVNNPTISLPAGDLTGNGTLTWDSSAAQPGDYYLIGGGLSLDGSTDAQDNSWIHVVLLSLPETKQEFAVLENKALEDNIDITSSDSDSFSLAKVLLDSATVSDETTFIDSDIYSINKGIQETLSAGSADNGSVIRTRSYVELGYFTSNALDYEYSSETLEETF